jgi:hypothetical protein
MSTPVAMFCHKLMNKFFKGPHSFKDNEYLKLNLPRYVEFEHVLRLVWTATQMVDNPLDSTEIQTTQKLEEWLGDYTNSVPGAVQAKLEKTLDIYLALTSHTLYRSIFKCKKVISPVEFHAFGILIYAHMDDLSTPDIAKSITGLRKRIDQHESKRFNKNFLQLSYDYIVQLPISKGGVVVSKDPTTLQLISSHNSRHHTAAPSHTPHPPPQQQPQLSAKASGKRKRRDDGSDSDTPLMDRSSAVPSVKRPSLSVATSQARDSFPLPASRRQSQTFVKTENSATPPLHSASLPLLTELQNHSASPGPSPRPSPSTSMPSSRYGLGALSRLMGRHPSAGVDKTSNL